MNFDESLKELREKHNMTQEQLAKKSGISSRMIQRYEYGISRPRLDAVEKIALALNVTTDELLGNTVAIVEQTNDKYSAIGAKQIRQLTEELTGIFVSGDIAEEELDLIMKTIQDAYWVAKEKTRAPS